MSVLPSTLVRCRRGAPPITATALVAALLLTGCSSSDDSPRTSDPEENTPSATGTTTPAPEDDAPAPGKGKPLGKDLVSLPEPERAQVTEGTRTYFVGVTTALSTPAPTKESGTTKGARKPAPGQPAGIPTDPTRAAEATGATGAALAELRNTATEYEDNGWQVTGRSKVVDEQVVRRVGDTSLVVRACVDNSSVRVVDAEGRPVPNSSPAPRTLNVLTLARQGDTWVVTEQRPARNPDC